jgi:drug/metabolite transporter (DMT)-like permease
VQLSFSTLPPFTKLSLIHFPPESIVFFRIILISIAFGTLLLFNREKIAGRNHHYYFAMLGFFGVAGNQYFYIKGVSYTTATNASILMASIPLLTLLTAVVLKKETLTFIKVAGVLVALTGVALLIDFRQFDLGGGFLGDLLILCNCSFYAVYLVLSKKMLKVYKPLTVITYVFIYASLLILPLTIGEVLKIQFGKLSWANYFPLLMVLILGTFVPYLTNTLALKHTHSSVVAVYIYIQPLLGTFLSAILIGEVISFKIIVSGLLILSGVSLATILQSIRSLKKLPVPNE